MASARYTRNITPDAPEEKHIMTRKEKWANFWHYYKWHILVALVAILIVGMFVKDIVSKVEPDYQFGVLSEKTLSAEALEALEIQLTPFANDRNGDGKVKVSVMEYTVQVDAATEDTVDAYTQMAGMTKLMADGQTGSSMLFFTSHPKEYHEKFGLFAYNDGSAVGEGSIDTEKLGVAWKDCPVLTGLPLGELTTIDGQNGIAVQDILADFYLVKRSTEGTSIAEDEKAMAYYNDAVALFAVLTEKGGN